MNRSIDETQRRHRVNYRRTLLGSVLLAGLLLMMGPAVAKPAMAAPDPQLEKAILIEDWGKVIRLLPKEAEPNLPAPLRLIKGHACLATNRNNESLALFLRAKNAEDIQSWVAWCATLARANPQSPIVYYLQGDAAARQKRWIDANDLFSKALRLKPGNPLYLNARAVALAASTRLDAARDDFMAGAQSASALADFYASRGSFVLQRKTDPQKALAYYEQALKICPNHVLALNGRGCAKMLLRQWDAATADLDAAHKLATAGLSQLTFVVSWNLSILTDERNSAVSAYLANAAGLKPGMSLNERQQTIGRMTRTEAQTTLNALANADNHNQSWQGSLFTPSKITTSLEGGVKGSLIGPTASVTGKIGAEYDLQGKAAFNSGYQRQNMDLIQQQFPRLKPEPISKIEGFFRNQMPGSAANQLTHPGGVSSQELASEPIDFGDWNVFTMYGLAYDVEQAAVSTEPAPAHRPAASVANETEGGIR